MDELSTWRMRQEHRGETLRRLEDQNKSLKDENATMRNLVAALTQKVQAGAYQNMPPALMEALRSPAATSQRVIATVNGVTVGIVVAPHAGLDPDELPDVWEHAQRAVRKARADQTTPAEVCAQRRRLPEPLTAIGWRGEGYDAVVADTGLTRGQVRTTMRVLRGQTPTTRPVIALTPAAILAAFAAALTVAKRVAVTQAKAAPSVATLATSATVTGVATVTLMLSPTIAPFTADPIPDPTPAADAAPPGVTASPGGSGPKVTDSATPRTTSAPKPSSSSGMPEVSPTTTADTSTSETPEPSGPPEVTPSVTPDATPPADEPEESGEETDGKDDIAGGSSTPQASPTATGDDEPDRGGRTHDRRPAVHAKKPHSVVPCGN